jgi:hypothetical protein
MESSRRRRVLIVANRTAATPSLLEEVSRLANELPSTFALLIPDAPSSENTDWTLELALPLLERAARSRIEGLTGEQDAFEAIRTAVAENRPDLIVISTLPRRVSKWLRRELPRRVEALGVPVTVITPERTRLRDGVTNLGGAAPQG